MGIEARTDVPFPSWKRGALGGCRSPSLLGLLEAL